MRRAARCSWQVTCCPAYPPNIRRPPRLVHLCFFVGEAPHEVDEPHDGEARTARCG
ncbi:MAG: hypothetical protein KatS3mg110_3225 [Pirellulaceae bacterium]|nr:MAG: hypothetical protein KatS3mg110_3225 [Pirellulaceae bacterium]